ncbi:MAG: hypothetical protein JOZ51_01130, partial [Chloroflexi bacterium]|nr:hypothetical protein [Chloroflexota bacterium]
MASRLENAALVAIRHYKRGQLFAWVNDTEHADREFQRCLRAIEYLKRRDHPTELLALEAYAHQAIGSKLRYAEPVTPDTSVSIFRRRIPMTYVLLVEASNRAEFRALVHLPWERLRDIADVYSQDQTTRTIVTDR